MIELTAKSANSLANAAKNKAYSYINVMTKNLDGATEMGRIFLGRTDKERNQAAKVLKGMIPEGCGKVYCTLG